MFILVNNNNEITAYSDCGGIEGSIEFRGSVPDDFKSDFKPKFYLLQNNEIVVNPNYQEPTVDIPETSGPSPEMLAINALGIQLAKHLAGGD